MVVRGVKAAEKSSFPVSQLDRISHMSSSLPCIIKKSFWDSVVNLCAIKVI
jgi:hypothetical protein